LGDPTQITQLFQNIIGNAIQYHDKAQGLVIIRCEDMGNLWKLSVSDNGPGIEEKDYERIFKIFQTGHRRSDDESTGIGLTVVKKIVERHGGAVWVQSEIGVGSTFFFTLPKDLKKGKL
jgi:signal transduction histidine kinase